MNTTENSGNSEMMADLQKPKTGKLASQHFLFLFFHAFIVYGDLMEDRRQTGDWELLINKFVLNTFCQI